MRDRAWLVFPASLALVLMVLALLIATRARAHSWYPSDCCSDRDCSPAGDGVVQEKADGLHVRGFGVLPYTDPRIRISRDLDEHVCTAPGRLICVFVRPKGN
jgi:hypothetical protein